MDQVAVVMVPFPAQGHLNQLLHLSRLITSYGIPVHYAGSTVHNRQVKLRLDGREPQSLSNIKFHDFDLPPFSSPPPNPTTETAFPDHLLPLFHASTQLRQPVSELAQQLSAEFRRIIVIHDGIMASVVQDVKCISNAESYIFNPCSAFTMFLGIWDSIPEKPFQLDSDVPKCIPSLEGCFTPEIASFMEKEYKLLDFQSGFIYNTSRVIEAKYLDLVGMLTPSMKHFALGPFNPVEMKSITEGHRHGCLEWLDKQEKHSVIYVSFGSTTSMTDEQIKELALGLETSGQKFLWVLRNADKGDIFAEDGEERKAESQLPEGYEERVKDRGMVVTEWAPQLEILAHPSTGGFMSHCGWNSCIESITMGVPIAAWPMHSDQPRNTVFITEVLRVGTVVREWANRAELTTSTMIEDAVRRLMASGEAEEMRIRAAELGEAVRGAVAEGGASRSEMESFIAHITR